MATAPFPFFYSAPYAYPQPASGFPPAPPLGYATFPSVADPAYPPYSVSPAPPIVAGAPTYSLPSTAAAYHHSFPSQIHTQNCQNWPPAASTPIHGDLHHHHFLPTHDHLTVEATPQPSAASTAPSQELCPPQPLASATWPDPTHLDEFALQLKIAHRSLLDISRQLDEYQDKSERSYASLKRGISKLLDRVSSSKSSTTTAPTPSVGFTPSSASSEMAESSTSVLSNTAPAYVGPQVLEEMPQQYGFHNLSRQTVRLADGTEHSYYVLPEDYPLERAVPEPVFTICDDKLHSCSNESDHVFTSTPEQQSHEEEQQNSAELIKCVGNAPETEQTSACLSYISDAVDYTLEQKQQDDENASVKVQLNLLITHERRKEWDPGDTHLHVLFTKAAGATKLEYTDVYKSAMVHVLVVQLRARRAPISESALMRAFGLGLTEVNASSCGNNRTSHSILNLFLQSLCATTAVQVTDCMQYIASNGINPVLHATVLTMQSVPYLSQGNYLCSLYCNSVQKTEYCLEISRKLYFWSATRLKWDPGVHVILYSYTATRPGGFNHVLQPIFGSAISCSYAFGLGWTEVELTATAALVLAVPRSKGKCIAKHSLCSCQMVIVEQIINFPSCATTSVHVTKQKLPLDVRLMAELQTVSEFSEVQPKYSGIIVGPLRNDLQGQSTMSNTTCVWDPGIQFILSMLWWLSKGTGHVFRHLLAVKFDAHTCTYFGDTAASMCCPPANLIPHRRKFAALPQFCHSILLSSVVCVWDPGIALVYQQSVQMNYIARNLLSSHNYLQILEMDIIFITFLPP